MRSSVINYTAKVSVWPVICDIDTSPYIKTRQPYLVKIKNTLHSAVGVPWYRRFCKNKAEVGQHLICL